MMSEILQNYCSCGQDYFRALISARILTVHQRAEGGFITIRSKSAKEFVVRGVSTAGVEQTADAVE